jgi:voltage-gated potassium channel
MYKTLIEKSLILKNTPCFYDLNLEVLLAIADKMSVLDTKKGEVIFTKGEDAHHLFIIAEGEIKVLYHETDESTMLYQGEVFGDEALLAENSRAYETRANTATTLLTLSKHHLHSIISEYPSIAFNFLNLYATILPCRPLTPSMEVSS